MYYILSYYTVNQKNWPPNTLSYSTVISQRFLQKVYDTFEKVRGCQQQLNPFATRRGVSTLLCNVDVKITLLCTMPVIQLKR